MANSANAYSLLRSNAPLRRLLTAQAFSDFADWLYYVAVATVLAYVLDVPTFVFALWTVALGAPYVVAGPLAGSIVDRMNIRTVLILSNLGRAITVAAMILANDWPILLALVFISGVVDSFFTPAKQAALQRFTTPSERMRANGISYAISQSSKIAAPAIGGLILAFSSPAAVFATNAVVSMLAALFCMRLAAIPRDVTALPEKS